MVWDVLVILYVIDTAAAAAVWAWVNLWPPIKGNLRHRIEPVEDDDAPLAGGTIAVICPGRDEAEHLPRTLAAMCEQDDEDYRVIFVDDDSSDQTPAVAAALAARYAHLDVVRLAGDPPTGWSGKCWALHRGYEHLKRSEAPGREARWLVFADADIDWQPGVLRAARRVAAEHEAQLVSMFPKLEFGSVFEAVVLLQLTLALGIVYPMDRAMDPAKAQTLTAGAFMMTRRDVYEKAGGHGAVAGEVVDDLALGRNLKAAGAKVRVGWARRLLRCRMYEGAGDLWEGLTKNAYAGVGHRWWAGLGAGAAAVLVNVLPPVYLVIAGVWCAWSPGLLSVATLGLAGLAVWLQARALGKLRRALGLAWWYGWTVPAGSAVYAAILLASMFQHHAQGGGVWKGRRFGG